MARLRPFDHCAVSLSKIGPVFPLAAGTKVPLAGSRGVRDATSERRQIDRWRAESPTANIGIATGNGLVVLDVDPRNGGDGRLAELVQASGPLTATLTTITPGDGTTRGRHLWFRGDLPSRSLGGIDVLGPGKYAVGAGSVTTAGSYLFEDPACPVADLPLSVVSWIGRRDPAPIRLLIEDDNRIGPRRPLSRRAQRLIAEGLDAHEHVERDTLLASSCLALVNAGYSLTEAEEILLDPANAVSSKLLERGPGWADRELRRTWSWAMETTAPIAELRAVGLAAVDMLDLRGKGAANERAVLRWFVEMATTHPSFAQPTVEGGVFTATVRSSHRVIASHLGMSRRQTVTDVVSRLVDAGLLSYRITGARLADGTTYPSRMTVRLPIPATVP